MSDLQKRLQEQNAANQKALAYRQANAKAVRAGQKEKAKRPDQPAEETKSKKPVAALMDDRPGFRFIFTADFIDTSADDVFADGLSVPGIFKRDYDQLTEKYGKGWPSALVQLNDLPPYLKAAGFALGRFATGQYKRSVNLNKRYELVGSLDPAVHPEVAVEPFVDLAKRFSDPILIAFQQSQSSQRRNALHNGLPSEFANNVGLSNMVICYEDGLFWNVAGWPAEYQDDYYAIIGGTVFPAQIFQDRLIEDGGDRVIRTYVPLRKSNAYINDLNDDSSWYGPSVDFHSFRGPLIRTCQEASENGAVVLTIPDKGLTTSPDGFLTFEGYYKGFSGVDQGAFDGIMDLLTLKVNALDLKVNISATPMEGVFTGIRPSVRQKLRRYIALQHPVALAIEQELSEETVFLVAMQHSVRASVNLFDQYSVVYPLSLFEPYDRYRTYVRSPYRKLREFLDTACSWARSAASVGIDNLYSEYESAFLIANLTSGGLWSRAEAQQFIDIIRVGRKAMAYAALSMLGPDAAKIDGNPQLELD